jgi:hypothetical protein
MTCAFQPSEFMSATPETLGLAMLQRDPHAWRLGGATQLTAVHDALADGASTAQALRARFAGLAPQQIARELGVPIEMSDDDPMIGSLWRFAEYTPRPARIRLYGRGLASLDRAMAGTLALQALGRATLQDVFVAHELFHHAEATRTEPPIARRYRPTLFRIGRWHWRTGIAALAEIAAGAFAQALLDLPCHPGVLDLIAADAISGYGRGTGA